MVSSNAERKVRLSDDKLPAGVAREEGDAPVPGPSTLEAVYRSEAPRLTRYFRSRLRPEEEAADLVQEAFVRLAGFMQHSALARPGAYLQRIARNLLYDRAKRLEFRLSAMHLPIETGFEPAVEADQDHGIEEADVLRIYRRALDELPARTREIFLLHRIDELTYREIGLKLAISVPTVQYHVARALAHIDAALEGE